jgi:hypothetical protein
MEKENPRPIIFHPITVLLVSCIMALIYSLAIIHLYQGEIRSFLLMYFMPIVIPFIAFLFERVEKRKTLAGRSWIMDGLVIGLSLLRTIIPIPLISGHALFLSYSLLTTKSWITGITAVFVLIEVAYIKVFILHDVTLAGGMILGGAAAFMYARAQKRKKYFDT